MVKRALTLLTSILFALPLLMPFNIYGAELSQTEIIGVDYNVISYSQDTNNSGVTFYNYTYEVEIKLKDNYVGVIDGTLTFNWINQDNSTGNPTSHNSSNKRKSYVNGNSFKTNIVIHGIYSTFNGKGPLTSVSYLVDNSDTNVVKYQNLDSIETVVNLLQDIYQNSSDIENLSTNQLVELEKIVSNTSLANQYLDTISKMKQWYFPFESFGIVANSLLNLNQNNVFNLNYWTFPIFTIEQGQNVYSQWGDNNAKYYFVFISNTNITTAEQFNNQFTIENVNLTVQRLRIIRSGWNLVKVTITKVGNGNFQLIANQKIPIYIPIYFGQDGYMSTDFALNFGFSNSYLDNINKIANGTTASQSAAQSSDSANSQLQTDSNTLFQQENGFKSDMNNAMQNVNTTFRLQDMGTKFVSSAQWVRTQYENLTNNTPFASLITFSLITGLALILLGKVYK